MTRKLSLFLALALTVLALAACSPSTPATPDNVLVPAPTIIPSPTSIPSDMPASPKGGCPAVTDGTKFFENAEDGYCLLYPAEFTLLSPRLIVLNPNGMPGDVPGDVWLYVLVSEAGGQTAAQMADAKISEWSEGFNITRTELTVDGKQAIVVDGLPGQDSNRQMFIVNNDRLYRFDFEPWFLQDGTTPLEKFYQLVVDTLHFLP